MKKLLSAIAGIFTLGSLSAEAASFTYDFVPPPGGVLPSFQVFSAGPRTPNLTVTGLRNGIGSDLNVINPDGVGVNLNPDGASTGRDDDVVEQIEFSFPGTQEVRLVDLTFTSISSLFINRTVTLSVDGGAGFEFTLRGPNSPVTVPASALGPDLMGNTFVFTPADNNDVFRITSATFVPEPLTILGTGLALVSMPLMKKAQQKK
ncbi:PEP-CTERM sorting domain-containing protein [Gloeocapsa sp. PCC 73106]|uniref:PEP-CTERM sorting domain-containing protein n=1 Tax=Gloeocapsa sp. PCC 73106 TaxID=102232 RepID=UPI0002ABD439|nr:PEP-CTERM sorting domain-containing protein [Gloeocapsa sp. PCC 73106]ELR99841.1 hypothetical protein GLO73106DRAFT_00036930 [Gloeocapsa sp. PCC 73106]